MSIDFLSSLLDLNQSQRRAARVAGNRIENENSSNPIPQDTGLVPVGNTGIYVTPNDPVDPWDCQRWPNSPYCQGDGFNPLDIVDADVAISTNECETCITVQPTVLYIYGPTTTVCYRAEACRPAPPVPPSDTSNGGEPYDFPAPQAPPGYCRVVYARQEIIYPRPPRFWSPVRQCYAGQGQADTEQRAGMGPEGVFIDTANGSLWTDPMLVLNYWAGATMQWQSEGSYPFCPSGGFTRPGGFTTIRTFFLWRDYADGPTPDPNGGLFEYKRLSDSCAGGSAPPPPIAFNPLGGDDMGCNCGEQEELLRAIYVRLGCDQYPVTVPQRLAGDNGKETEIPSLTQLLGWFIQQTDGLLGQWPVEIEIEDDDPLEEGEQRKKVTLPNVAETLAELFGLVYKNDVRGDIDTEILLRMVAELISTKNAALITQDYTKANASFLGYKGNPTRRRIDYAFDPTQLDSLPNLLKESKQYITGYEDDDSENLVSYLQRLMFAAGIIKTVFMRTGEQGQDWIDSVRNLAEDALRQDFDWEVFLRRVKDPNDPINRGAIPKPDATDVRSGGPTLGDLFG